MKKRWGSHRCLHVAMIATILSTSAAFAQTVALPAGSMKDPTATKWFGDAKTGQQGLGGPVILPPLQAMPPMPGSSQMAIQPAQPSQPGAAAKVATPVLQGLLISGSQRVAIIDGQLVEAGEKIGKHVLRSIEEDGVTLVSPIFGDQTDATGTSPVLPTLRLLLKEEAENPPIRMWTNAPEKQPVAQPKAQKPPKQIKPIKPIKQTSIKK